MRTSSDTVNNDTIACPGVCTPTEVRRATLSASKGKNVRDRRELSLMVKVFPASSGRAEHIRAMKAGFPGIRFIPLGGVTPGNIADLIKAGAWAIGGTWFCKKELIDGNEMQRITELTGEALRLLQEARQTRSR